MKIFYTRLRTTAALLTSMLCSAAYLHANTDQIIGETAVLRNVTSTGCTFTAKTFDSPFELGQEVTATFTDDLRISSCRLYSEPADLTSLNGRTVRVIGTRSQNNQMRIAEITTIDDCSTQHKLKGIFKALEPHGVAVMFDSHVATLSFPKTEAGEEGDTLTATIRSCDWTVVRWSDLKVGDSVVATFHSYDYDAHHNELELEQINISTQCFATVSNPTPDVISDMGRVSSIEHHTIAVDVPGKGIKQYTIDDKCAVLSPTNRMIEFSDLKVGDVVTAYSYIDNGTTAVRSIKTAPEMGTLTNGFYKVEGVSSDNITVVSSAGNKRTITIAQSTAVAQCSGQYAPTLSSLDGHDIELNVSVDGKESEVQSISITTGCPTQNVVPCIVSSIGYNHMRLKPRDVDDTTSFIIPVTERTAILNEQQQPITLDSLSIGMNVCAAFDTTDIQNVMAIIDRGGSCITLQPSFTCTRFTGVLDRKTPTEITLECPTGAYTLPYVASTRYLGCAPAQLTVGDSLTVFSYSRIAGVWCVADVVMKTQSVTTDINNDNYDRKSSLSVWPNPSINTLYVSSTDEGITALQLYSIDGTLALHTHSSSTTIDVSSLSPGSYTLVATHANGKIIVSRISVVR